MRWGSDMMQDTPLRRRLAETAGDILVCWPSVGLLLFAFVIPRLGAVMGPVFIVAGCLATMIGPGAPEIGDNGRDYGFERRRGIMFAGLGLVLSVFRLLPVGF